MRLPYPVRAAGARLLRRVRIPIRSGPNAGLRWSLASSGRGYLEGDFEAARVETFVALTKPGDCVWDVGAHKGYLTLAFARRVGAHGRVVAIEPSRRNQWFLRRHLGWNDVDNVEPLRVAVSDASGTGRFGGTGSTLAFQLGRGDETVRVATLDELLADGRRAPDVVKIDVEGAEDAVLAGADRVLGPTTLVFLAVHGRQLYERCRAALAARGFRIRESWAMRRLVADASLDWGGDHDLVAFGPDRDVDPDRLSGLPLLRPDPPARS